MILTGVYTSIAPDLSYFLGENNLSNYKNDEIISTINEINNITDQEQSKKKDMLKFLEFVMSKFHI